MKRKLSSPLSLPRSGGACRRNTSVRVSRGTATGQDDAMPMVIEGQAMARCSVRKKKRAKPMPDKGLKKRKGSGSGSGSKKKKKKKKKKKAKLHDVDDEVKDETMVADAAGSNAPTPATETETVTMDLDLIEHYLVEEVVGYMTCALLCPILHLKSIACPFDPTLLDPFEKEANFCANVLQQHRLTNGPVQLQMEHITTDDDDHDHDHHKETDRRGWMNW